MLIRQYFLPITKTILHEQFNTDATDMKKFNTRHSLSEKFK